MFYMIIMGILSLCVAIFAVQNAVSVEVSFLFWHFSMSLALIIIGSLLIGLVLSGLIALKVKAGHFMKERRLKGQIKALEEENAENRRKMGTFPILKQDLRPLTRPKRMMIPSSNHLTQESRNFVHDLQ